MAKDYWLPQSSLAYIVTGYGLADESHRQTHKNMLSTAAQVISIKAVVYMTFVSIASLLLLFGESDITGIRSLAALPWGESCLIPGLFSSLVLALANGFISLALLTLLSRIIQRYLE